MAMFVGFYAVLLVTFFVLARRRLRNGPDLTIAPPDTAASRTKTANTIAGY